MIETTVSPTLLLAAGFLTISSVILGLYIFVLNPRLSVNRYVSLGIIVMAVSNIGAVLALQANTYNEAYTSFVILVISGPATAPLMALVSLKLIKPAWISGRMRWLLWLLLLLAVVPLLLTTADVAAGTRLYFTPPDMASYSGGFLDYDILISGAVGPLIVQLYLVGINSILFLPLLYFSFLDRKLETNTRKLAILLTVAQLLGAIVNFVFQERLPAGFSPIVTGAIFNITYAYAAFQQMISARSLVVGSLQNRLTTVVLCIMIPFLVFVVLFLTEQTRDILEGKSLVQLEESGDYLVVNVDQLLDANVTALQYLANQPAIISMDPAQQKPLLEAMVANYPYMYLVSTTDLLGMNIARSDAEDPKDYSDRFWYQNAVGGAEITFQTLIGRTTGQPALVVSTPIRDINGDIIGVCMFASHLTSISDNVLRVRLGDTGFAYVFDNNNQLVAHPELQPGMEELVDYSQTAPVVAFRNGEEPPITFTDEEGINWRAYFAEIGNGWGVVVQQSEKEISEAAVGVQRLGAAILVVSSLILFVLIYGTIRQATQPINSLTETVKAIASGNLDRSAPVESEDEIGTLARAFNSMTSQLRDLITSLERRVAERTLDLELRSAQLRAAADVGHATATLRNLNELLPLVARLIAERFDFYHVGIFLLDEAKEYAVLRASNSEGGLKMLARGHRLQVGQQGIVGFVADKREPRIALNVGEDAVFFDNPDLPHTQSEVGLPLVVGNNLLGVLDVQSDEASAFTEQDVRTLQVLADQVAIAINSAQLVQQTEQLLEAERHAYGEVSLRAWVEQSRGMSNLGFARTHRGILSVREIGDEETRRLVSSGQATIDASDASILYLPVMVRNRVIGILRLKRSEESQSWSQADIQVVKSLAEQLGIALESARTYQTTQSMAQRERLLGEISARVRETLDIEAIIKTTAQEVHKAMDVSRVTIRLGKPAIDVDSGSNGHRSNPEGRAS